MEPNEYYKNKIIVVTGGVGSIGSQLIHELVKFNPKRIRVFDNNETGLFDLENELHSPIVRPFLGDIRDKERLAMAFNDTDIVFHAAALKHVPLCEYNPFDAIKTNVIGTQNVIDAALESNVGKVINISTDKAVNPSNVMGATKLLTEKLIVSAAYYQGNHKTIFSNVRFGNVLNSRGSVIPVFRKQIQKGGPVTVTDPQMTRFCMRIPDAVSLIVNAGIIARGREIFILKMPGFLIQDMAATMREYYGPKYGFKPKDMKIEIIGKREGEKVYEELMTIDEAQSAYENQVMYLIPPPQYPYEDRIGYTIPPGFTRTSIKEFSSRTVKLLSQPEILAFLRECENG